MIKTYDITCGAAPVQVEGTLEDGRFFYFRSRHTTMSLGLSDVSVWDAVSRPAVGFSVNGLHDDPHIASWIPHEDAVTLIPILVRLWDAHVLAASAGTDDDIATQLTGVSDGEGTPADPQHH